MRLLIHCQLRKSAVDETRILFVLPRMVSGGVERVTLNLIGMLRADGVDCALALRRSHGELLSEAQALVPVHELAGDGLAHFIPRLARLIGQWQPTHVVTAFADIALMTSIALQLARSRAALVHGVHDSHGPEVAKPGMAGRLRHAINNVAAGLVYRRAAAIVSVSDGARDEVLSRYHIPPKRVHTIYNPVISEDQLRPREPAISNGAVRIVALGRLTRQKGFDLLIQAMANVKANRPWQLEVYGEGTDRAQLERLIQQNGLSEKVRLCGYTNLPFEVLRDADIFVLSSRHEGLPTVLIEALASQVQIIATDCRHGPREILQGGCLGTLVPTGDVVALADAISRTVMGECWVDPRLLLARARDFSLDASHARWADLLCSTRGA